MILGAHLGLNLFDYEDSIHKLHVHEFFSSLHTTLFHSHIPAFGLYRFHS